MDDSGTTQELDQKDGRVIPDDLWGILCVYAEARGEPYEGQVAVGNVIRTRTKRQFFSDGSVVSTVTMPFQFSWMNHGDRQRTRVLGAQWDDAMRKAARAWFESEHNQVVKDATHYYASYIAAPAWARANRMEFVAQIGRHMFYRELRG